MSVSEVIVLAGGLGTRLRAVVPDLPKPLAPVAGLVGVFGYLAPPGWVDDPATHAALLVLRLVGMVVWTVWALAKGDGEQGIALARASRLPPSLVLVVTIALRFVPRTEKLPELRT